MGYEEIKTESFQWERHTEKTEIYKLQRDSDAQERRQRQGQASDKETGTPR